MPKQLLTSEEEFRRYAAKLAVGKRRRDRALHAAEGCPRVFEGRPHTIHDVDGFTIHMKRFAEHAEHGIRVDVEIYKDGELVHQDDHVVVNPPTVVIVEGGMFSDPVLALAHTVLEASRVKK